MMALDRVMGGGALFLGGENKMDGDQYVSHFQLGVGQEEYS